MSIQRRGKEDDRHLWPEMRELLTRQDRLGCLARMCLESSAWNATMCHLNRKISATPASRLLCQLVPWTQSIEECESGLWATPTAFDHVSPKTDKAITREITETRKGRTNFANLRDQVVRGKKMYPTMDVGAAKGRGEKSAENRSRLGGTLNPEWVEWLMGYPIGHTACGDSEMPSSRKSRKR